MDNDPTRSVSARYFITIAMVIDWRGPQDNQPHRCDACGTIPKWEHGNLPAIITIYDTPSFDIVKDANTEAGEVAAEKWYREVMTHQLNNIFVVSEVHHWCWACVGNSLIKITGNVSQILATLVAAMRSVKDEQNQPTRPFTSVLFLQGERGLWGEAGHILAHMKKDAETTNLVALLKEGARRLDHDEFDISLDRELPPC